MKKLLLHPKLKPLLMLTIVVVTIASGIQLYSQKDYKQDVAHVELTEDKLQEISKPVPNQIVVNFAKGTTQEQKDEYIKSIGGTISSESDALNSAVINLSENIAVADLPKSDFVAEPEENYFVMALENPVNDPEYSNQWSLPVIKAPELWSTGSQDNKIVAVIDSGICDQHPELQGRIVAGYDFIEMDTNAFDDNGHGCSVSGIIAANINDGIGIAGVGKNVKIMPLKVLDSLGIGTYSNVANAIVYAVDHGADIINLSLGGVNPSTILSNAISYAETNNVIVVAAAGNTGTEGVLYPAGYPYVISVGSTNEQLQQSTFSSYGPGVDILAPGERILTTGLDDSYRYVNGTSYSAPIVSGILTMTSVGELELSEGNVLGDLIINEIAEGVVEGAAVHVDSVIQLNNVSSNIKVLKIDTTNREIEFEVVTAGDTYNGARETLANIVNRKQALGGINTDYFGDPPNPAQGTTYVKGNFKGDLITSERGTCRRSSLKIASNSAASIGWCESGYNVTGAGPKFLINGVETWTRTADGINNEYFPGTSGWDSPRGQSGAGVSQDGRYLILGSSNDRDEGMITPLGMATILKNNGAHNAIRLDGGGSTQMFYKNQMLVNSVSRPLAAALVFYYGRTTVGGVVRDTAGNPVSNALVAINSSAGIYKEARTNSQGIYTIKNIPEGSIVITALNQSNQNGTSLQRNVPYNASYGIDLVLNNQCTASLEDASDQACSPGTPGDGGSTNQGDSSDFITDVTIPDKTVVGLNSSFTKIWRLKNNGTSTWNSGYKLVFQTGYRLGAPTEVALNQNVSPGATVDISVNMVSPNIGGTYKGYWKLKNSGGQLFGDQVWVEIIAQTGATTPTNTGSGQVKLFANANYANQIGTYGTGDTNHPNANSFSIEIPNGWSVKAYSSDNYSGEETCWYQSKANLTDITWSLKIQSIRVYNYYACGGAGDANGKVRMYAHAEFENFIDEYGFGQTQGPNNNAKSMQIPSGWSVKTFRGNNYDGGDRCWNSSVRNLEDFGWQYDIDSMEVFPTNVCPNTDSYVDICRNTGHTDCTRLTTDISNLHESGFGNDILKSLKIQGNWSVAMYEHENYKGKKFLSTSSHNDLRSNLEFGYGASSIRIRRTSNQAFTLHDNINFSGTDFRSDRAVIDFDEWNFNDRGDSIEVHGNYEIVMCTNGNFQDFCRRTKTSISNLGTIDSRLVNGISSIQVCVNECPAAAATPTLNSPLNGVSYLPGSNITFAWGGNGNGYTIEVSGGGLQGATYNWTDSKAYYTMTGLPGSAQPYTWKVRGWNSYGEGNWSSSNTFYILDTAINSIDISAPSTVETNTNVAFTTNINPADATNVVYNWTPTPATGQNTNNATYNFNSPGIRNITVTASNTAGTVQATKQVTVICPAGYYEVEYFDKADLTNSNFKTCRESLNESWGTSGPNGVGNADFSGSAKDGNITIAAGNTLVTDPQRRKLTAHVAAGATSITTDNVTGLTIGDEVMVIHMKSHAAGLYDTAYITAITGNTITLNKPLVNQYHLDYNQIQVVRIPNYDNLTVNGTLTVNEWDKFTGGVLAFRARTVNIGASGIISATAKGYKGGGRTYGKVAHGTQGESIHAPGGGVSRYPNWNGGGGGPGTYDGGAGAGGGSYATPGGNAKDPFYGDPGLGAYHIYGDEQNTRLYFGGGAGSGGTDDSAWDGVQFGGFGGHGGGIIFAATNKIIGTGKIESNGGAGENHNSSLSSEHGGGGGGAGGSIELIVQDISLTNIQVNGGPGGRAKDGMAGNGGYGRTSIDYCNVVGANVPGHLNKLNSCVIDNFSARYTKTQNFTAGTYKFTSKADDGIKVWIDDELIINQWTSGYKEKEVSKTISEGNHNIKVEYMELTGDAKVSLDIVEVVAPPVVTNVFTGEYFNNKTLTGTPVITNTTQVIDYGWNGSPGTGIGSDNFSVRWTGQFNFPTAGDYTFTGNGDDGIRLFVDDIPIFNGWVDQGFTKYQGVANLTAGIHTVRYEYYEAGGGAAVTLTWEAGNTMPVSTACTTNNNEFCAKYYNSQTPANGSVLARRETGPIDYDWGQSSPSPVVRSNDFSGKWVGKFNFNAGTYKFTHSADDGVRAWIDNVLFIDRWNGQSYDEETTTKVMSAGLHDIKVEFLEWGGGAQVKFVWEQESAPANTAPVVTQIPGQTKTQGQAFTTINLANYVTDTAGDTITWSYSGNTNLTVSISNNIATITAPANWTGTNNIKFRATDSGGLFAESTAAFVVNAPSNTAPVVTQIPGQIITQGGTFNTINLNNYVSDPGDTITWSYTGNTNLTVSLTNNIATITAPSGWTGTNNIAFKATDSGGLFATSTASFTVNTTSVGTELLTTPWNLAGNNGASEKYQTISSSALAGKTTMRITYNLHGMNALGGDASAIIFDQNGWKYISLSNYGQNGLNGVQTVDIPLSAFTGLNLTTGSTTLHTRFWYGSAFTVDITSIKVF